MAWGGEGSRVRDHHPHYPVRKARCDWRESGRRSTLVKAALNPRAFMKRLIAFVVLAAVVGACTPDSDTTGSISSCARELYPGYNSKSMDQCVAVCKKCDRGVTTTCTTSCTLKGAH
jgi:hypothetical protein